MNLDNATYTYYGKNECACGCGGSYADANSTTGQKRIKKILSANPAKIKWFDFGNGEGCYELENGEGTRVTRIYIEKVGA